MTFFEFLAEWWFLLVAILTGVIGFVTTQTKTRGRIATLEDHQRSHEKEDQRFHKELSAEIRGMEVELRDDLKEVDRRSNSTDKIVTEIKVKMDLMYPMIEVLYKNINKK